ncbi:glycosyltransferase family 2 protein [Synechococcus sp. UW179B]|uniref:glycosyltransferase family 2 protein n=1 Tax=Synechococcus sp. UW179B TaxID=2575516 RepID=UPI0018E0B85A|nr:glycosyltransferase family 2 protein [Synechococcus sp. UW179B]
MESTKSVRYKMNTRIDLLVPCFNEEECLPRLFDRLRQVCSEIKGISWKVIIVNDGSSDNTLRISKDQLRLNGHWCEGIVINFSRNFGKEAALIAGLDQCNNDACIIMDADLQDPPELLPELIQNWQDGYKVVSAARKSRTNDGYLKRITAKNFYKFFQATSKLEISQNASDFRLLDRQVIEAIRQCRESIRFSKGFFAWAGFKQITVYFKRPEREAGTTKWGGWKLWNYALDGIFNYSTSPLRIWTYLGLTITTISFLLAIKTVFSALIGGVNVPGYASIFTAVTFLGGVQLIGIGILGEYLGRAYVESKRRPIYIIESMQVFEDK